VGRTLKLVLRSITVVALAAPLILTPSAGASCAPPELRLSQDLVSAGSVVKVRGDSWFTGCDDWGSVGACSEEREESQPMSAILVTLRRDGGGTVQETTADGPDWTIRVLTEGLTPGMYEVVAEHGDSEVLSVPLRVKAP
jgi:hypothetical protein